MSLSTAIVSVSMLLGGAVLEFLRREIDGNAEDISANGDDIHANADDIDSIDSRVSSIEQLITGENGNSTGALERAADERDAIANQLDKISETIEDVNRKNRVMAIYIERIQQTLNQEENVDVDLERIDLQNDFIRGD